MRRGSSARMSLVVAFGLLHLGVCTPGHAGPLTPPPGPVASTLKPLSEVEPRTVVNATNTPGDADSVFRISTPGSYYLAANVSGVAAKAGIEIAADNVTLDLRGFQMTGVAGSLAGIRVPAAQRNLCIGNGSVCSWGARGVDAALATNSDVHDVRACSNTFTGISVGDGATVRDCTAESNGGAGVFAGQFSTVTHCTGRLNAQYGIGVSLRGTVSFCAGGSNTDSGIAVGAGSTVSFCVAQGNGTLAAALTRPSEAAPAKGARMRTDAILEEGGSATRGAPFNAGIFTGGSSTITGCTTTQNSGNGIELGGSGGSVIGCTSTLNTVDGIVAALGGQVLDCRAGGNNDDGIQVDEQCVVMRNCADNNDNDLSLVGAGIHATLGGNRIEDNTVMSNFIGVLVDVGGNIVMRNRATANPGGAYFIAPLNAVAPIVPVAGLAPFAGVDPNANLMY